ncbi:MAG: hypothetical protein EBU83_05870 [bacterium]|nr:hypothetical protein [Candidatus Aquidulcis sp.]
MSPDPSSHSPAARAEDQALALGFAHDGERRAFERFREELTPHGWVIAHNLYVARREERGSHTHELDLLLLHPQRGMVMVEVKCGRVERTSEGAWLQNGSPMRKPPDLQATRAIYELRDVLKDHPLWERLGINPASGWMLALPDADATKVMRQKIDGTINLASDQVIDRIALAQPGAIVKAVETFATRISKGIAGADPGFDWTKQAMIHRDWVENLAAFSRLHFDAGAGAGKSVVARLRAFSLAEAGQRVLFICSTASLAKSMQSDVAAKGAKLITVNTAHQALIVAARATGNAEEYGINQQGPLTDEALASVLPNAGRIAAASRERYDALIVDEAQDLGPDVVLGLTAFLKDPTGGSIWTFADEYQRLSTATQPSPALNGVERIVMRQNHRNPEPVFRLAEGLRSDGIKRFSRKGAVSSHRVEYRPIVDGTTQRATLEELLDELLRQGITPGRIAVVTVSGKTRENPLFHPRRIGKFVDYGNPQLDERGNRIPVPPEELPAPDPGKVYFDSVRRIKGLERGVVILVDVPHPGEVGSEERRLLYAAATRATTYLAIIGTAANLGAIKKIADSYR